MSGSAPGATVQTLASLELGFGTMPTDENDEDGNWQTPNNPVHRIEITDRSVSVSQSSHSRCQALVSDDEL